MELSPQKNSIREIETPREEVDSSIDNKIIAYVSRKEYLKDLQTVLENDYSVNYNAIELKESAENIDVFLGALLSVIS